MERLVHERDRLQALLSRSRPGSRFAQLYAAQHTLNWVLNPERFAPPFGYITDIREGSPDCLADTRQALLPERIVPMSDAV
jgi:hypothetical protein